MSQGANGGGGREAAIEMMSAWHRAAQTLNVNELRRILANSGGDVDQTDSGGRTALHYVQLSVPMDGDDGKKYKERLEKCVKFLVEEKEANVDAKDCEGQLHKYLYRGFFPHLAPISRSILA